VLKVFTVLALHLVFRVVAAAVGMRLLILEVLRVERARQHKALMVALQQV
jgi:hypothetical protein